MVTITQGGKIVSQGGKIVTQGMELGTLPSLKMWFAARFETGFSNTNPVPSIKDLSSNGHSAIQATSGQRATYRTAIQNGLAAFLFDGVDDTYPISTLDLGKGIAGWTFFVVYRKNSIAATQYILGTSGNTSIGYRIQAVINQTTSGILLGATRQDSVAQQSVSFNQLDTNTHVLCGSVDFPSGRLNLYQDGLLLSSIFLTDIGALSTNANATAQYLGGNFGGGSTFNGYLFELLYCEKNLSEEQKYSVMNYLKTLYAI